MTIKFQNECQCSVFMSVNGGNKIEIASGEEYCMECEGGKRYIFTLDRGIDSHCVNASVYIYELQTTYTYDEIKENECFKLRHERVHAEEELHLEGIIMTGSESTYSSCEYSVVDGRNFSRKIIKGNNIAGLVGYIADGVGVLTFQIAISVLLALFFKPVYGIIAAVIFAVIKMAFWRLSLVVDNLFFRKIDNVRPVKKIFEHFLVSDNIAECFKE